MSILVKTVRIAGFRGLENIEVELEQTTILTGMNNTGKTSFLKALQLALGNRQFISQDDFFIKEESISQEIIIDILIVPANTDGSEEFSEDWEILFTKDRIQEQENTVQLRTIITFNEITNSYKTDQFILQDWPEFKQDDINWFEVEKGKKTSFNFDEIPFFYMDAQRDILEDIKLRNSYLGRMLSKMKYSDEDTEEIEIQIKALNELAISRSDILSNIKTTLKELDTAMDTQSEGLEITPFTKKIRDLNKGLKIYYSDQKEAFPMENHGMGTRSWSSLLTLKAFISLLANNFRESVFFPILAVEEPEAHLHPNAQKRLYEQINSIVGQKIISTHSPYIAATAKLEQIRNFYKDESVTCGRIEINNLTSEDVRKINRQVINTRGEIFFSKLIIFFEGETEEQALPIFAEEYFNKTPVEMGFDFVGVGGCKSYLPFLRFAENLHIPWFILSDAEPEAIKWVKKHFEKCKTSKNINDIIVFLNEGNDFEKQLINDGFSDEIKQAIASFDIYGNEQYRLAKERKRLKEIENFSEEKLYEIITKSKTKYGHTIAEKIVKSDKNLPPKIIDLFSKISNILRI